MIKQQHHPSHMETSKHHTYSKTKQSHDISTSYRPIAPLSVIAKTLEKTLLPYIPNNIPHIYTQHGFKSKHSTSTTLHAINNTIATGFNPKNRTHNHSSTRHEQSIRHSKQHNTTKSQTPYHSPYIIPKQHSPEPPIVPWPSSEQTNVPYYAHI